jgi:hypothetical protein
MKAAAAGAGSGGACAATRAHVAFRSAENIASSARTGGGGGGAHVTPQRDDEKRARASERESGRGILRDVRQ